MGSGGKSGGSVKNYYGSCAGVVCAGPVDELVSLIVDGSTVWPTKKFWANGCVDVPIISLQRKDNKARVEFAAPMNFKKAGKIWISGCTGADISFNTGIAANVTDKSATIVWYSNPGPNVARHNVSSGAGTVVLQYALNTVIGYAGGIWKAKSTHWGGPAQAPPNATYWEAYSVLRSVSANPFPFTVENFGQAYFYWGTSDQELDAVGERLLSQHGHPPYRRQAVLVVRDFLFGQERQAAPNIEVVVRRTPQQTVIAGASANLADSQANPLAAAAELLEHPVFGLGQDATLLDSASWQAQADALSAIASQAYTSPLLSTPGAYRAFCAQLLAYFDGWIRWSTAGAIEAGRFLHNAAPPAFDAATTIDYHDLVEEAQLEVGGWADTTNETVVKFTDRARAYKDAARSSVSGFNRDLVGEPRQAILDRPWIMREVQAAAYAAEWGKINAQPKLAGSLVVRAEKVAAIAPGGLFRLTHDPLALSVVCRCIEKSLAAPPAGRATIRFESERGIAPLPYQPTAAAPGGTTLPPAEPIVAYQFVQPPSALSGNADHRVTVLAARRNELTKGLRLWFRVDDENLFYNLGEQQAWAVHGLLAQDYDANLPDPDTDPLDDDSETLQLSLDEFTVQADIDGVSQTQTADAVNDDALLVWLFSAADPTQFEICTLKELRLDGDVYKLKVRRARFATTQRAFVTGDRAFIIHREDLASYTHARFASYIESGAAAVFRLQAFAPHDQLDLSDADECPDINFLFGDPYAPVVEWTRIEYNGVAVVDFAQPLLPYGQFRVGFTITDANADLVEARLVARLGTLDQHLWSMSFPPSSVQIRETSFSLAGDGAWGLFLITRDGSGRVLEHQMQPVGGGDPVQFQIQEAGQNKVASPVPSPPGGGYTTRSVQVTLSCPTAGATIHWQLKNVGEAPGAVWTTYINPVLVGALGQKRLYVYASKAGMDDSTLSYHDYWNIPR